MVKGTTRQVVVVKGAEPKLFEQAIFLLREDALAEGISDDELLRQARQACRIESASQAGHSRLTWTALGAGATGILWLITTLF